MAIVRCPDCGEAVGLSGGVRSGDLVECPNCAGHAMRVRQTDDGWSATVAHRVSCPGCDQLITLPEGVRAGDTVACCGQTYALTFEYGAFAAEKREALP